MPSALDGAEFLEWLQSSQASFDVVQCNRSEVPEHFFVIDKPKLDAEFREMHASRSGVHKPTLSVGAVHRVAGLFSRRLANANSGTLGVPHFALANAWFSPINSELSTFLPVRCLARYLSVSHPDGIFAIHLPSLKLTSLKAWQPNDMEPIYLAYELRRRRANVFLFSDEETDGKLSLKLSNAWLRKRFPEFQANEDFSEVLCRSSMRRPDYVADQVHMARRIRPKLTTLLRYLADAKFSRRFMLDLKPGPPFGKTSTLSAFLPRNSMELGFKELMLPLTKKVAAWYQNVLDGKSIESVHIADHTSLEGGLLAGCGANQGGKTCLWPHSANVVQMNMHDADYVKKVTVAARSTGIHWAKKLGEDRVTLDKRTILPEMAPAPQYDDNRPVTVILFAGAHSLLRVPLIDYVSHTNTWREALEAILSADVELKVKHKSIWETREWIASMAPKGANLEFTNVKATNLNLPNMLFMSVSFTSTAIFEGISRGIPGAIIQKRPYEETPYYNPEYIPRVHPDELKPFLGNLKSKENWAALARRQMTWFKKETS